MNFCKTFYSKQSSNSFVSFISPEKVEDVAGTIANEVGVVIFGVWVVDGENVVVTSIDSINKKLKILDTKNRKSKKF